MFNSIASAGRRALPNQWDLIAFAAILAILTAIAKSYHGISAPLPQSGQGYGLGLGVRPQEALSGVPGSVGDYYWGGALGPYFWVDPAEDLIVIFMLQELNVQRRVRYRSLLRALVYQALQ